MAAAGIATATIHENKRKGNEMRITQKDLESVVARINRICGTPTAPYSKDVAGNISPNANCYHLSYAYGGVQLVRMSSTPGCTGVSNVIGTGHIPKSDLYNRMQAYIAGLEVAR